MKLLKPVFVLAVAGLFLVAASSVRGDVAWRTPLTLSEQTEIPGKLLPPGDYLVKVLDTQETRMVVQFASPDETKVFATVIAVPNYRVKVSEEGQFTYFQRSPGAPQALKTWVYPGNNFGIEFVYPREKAMIIAKTSREEVYSAPSAKPEVTEQVVAISPELKEEPVRQTAPPPAPVVAEKAPAPAPAPPPATLPQTAGNSGLLALAGFALLGVAATLRFFAAR